MPEPFTLSIDDVRDKELEYIVERRRCSSGGAAPARDAVANSLVGLALSGGGIRSATTNLGILQALSKMRILPLVDYVSTVSGGGYIGSCLASLLSINKTAAPGADDQFDVRSAQDLRFTTEWKDFPFNPELKPTGGERCSPQAVETTGKQVVAHLRTHGNFLVARRGLLKRDALRSAGHLLTGTLYHLLNTLFCIAVAALLLMGAAHVLDPGLGTRLSEGPPAPPAAVAPADTTEAPSWQQQFTHRFDIAGRDVVTTFGDGRWVKPVVWGASTSVFVLILFLVAIGVRRSHFAFAWMTRGEPGETAEDRFERYLLWIAALVVGLAVAGAAWVHRDPTQVAFGWVLLPAIVLASARLATLLLYPLLAMADGALVPFDLWSPESRSLWGAFQAITTYGTFLFLLFACLPVAAYAAANVSPWVIVAPLVSLVAGRLLLAAPVENGTRRIRLPRALVHVLLALALTVFVAFLLLEAAALAVHFGFDRPWTAGYRTALAAAGLPLLVLTFIGNINKVSPHYFYRDRILETYLRTEVSDPDGRLVSLRDTASMLLTDLHGRSPNPDTEPPSNSSPYLLVSAAINLAGSRDLTRKDRKSGYFLFSKYYCGSAQTGYRLTSNYRGGSTRLGRAITISGAAAGSAMGFHTFFAQSAFMTILNLRLGYWMSNPYHNATDVIAFWPRYILREIFGGTNERTPLVNLSDGGHTGDNIGIYPLLERRCQVIIACDAEADARLSFGSFTEALRHAYIDLGVDVDIDLSMIRPDEETGLSRSHCAVGRVRYPECPDRPNWLVYLKNSLTGDEPAPLLNYKSSCPTFPHESTGDQFFDDAQFESYRALGVHIAEDTFAAWASEPAVRDAWTRR